MVNTSATGGPLLPATLPVVLEGAALEDFFHNNILVPLTGLNGKLVRPSWQGEPPNIPQADTNWLAFNLVDEGSDTYPWVGHTVSKDGLAYQLQRNEEFGVVCSFYSTGTQPGSEARKLAKLLRDNLAIEQNREPLFNAGMGLIEVTAPQPAPLLVKERWLYRLDMTLRIRRVVVRTYPVETFLSAKVDFIIDAETKRIDRTTTVENET